MKYCTKVRDVEISTKRDTGNVMGREKKFNKSCPYTVVYCEMHRIRT